MKRAQVTAISDLKGLRAIETDWTSVHEADPHATVFTSWAWIWGRLSALTTPWWVLVARGVGDGRVVGLLPLRTAKAEGQEALSMAGSPLADYTGLLCFPSDQDAVLAAFADYMQQHLSWRRLELHDVRDPRLDAFLSHFQQSAYETKRLAPTPCPGVELEPSWEGYLATRLNPRWRQTLRRKLRAIERLPDLRITHVTAGGEAQIAILLELWQRRWGQRPESELEQFRSVFRSCLRSGTLWLDMFWDGEKPLAGLLAFLDPERSRFCFYISGYNPDYAQWSPGTVMVAHSVREAIRMGFRTYDFLRGDEAYKYSFGARLEESENIDIVCAEVEDVDC